MAADPYSSTTYEDFARLNRFVSVRFKQGMPLVDADLNEAHHIQREELRSFIKWFVGDGVPDGEPGFEVIEAAYAGGVEDRLAVRHGRMLVDGVEVFAPPRDGGRWSGETLGLIAQPLRTSKLVETHYASRWEDNAYELLPGESCILEAPGSPLEPVADNAHTVCLETWEREVTADEEPMLKNARLGLESSRRLRREWRIRVFAGDATENPEIMHWPNPHQLLRQPSRVLLAVVEWTLVEGHPSPRILDERPRIRPAGRQAMEEISARLTALRETVEASNGHADQLFHEVSEGFAEHTDQAEARFALLDEAVADHGAAVGAHVDRLIRVEDQVEARRAMTTYSRRTPLLGTLREVVNGLMRTHGPALTGPHPVLGWQSAIESPTHACLDGDNGTLIFWRATLDGITHLYCARLRGSEMVGSPTILVENVGDPVPQPKVHGHDTNHTPGFYRSIASHRASPSTAMLAWTMQEGGGWVVKVARIGADKQVVDPAVVIGRGDVSVSTVTMLAHADNWYFAWGETAPNSTDRARIAVISDPFDADAIATNGFVNGAFDGPSRKLTLEFATSRPLFLSKRAYLRFIYVVEGREAQDYTVVVEELLDGEDLTGTLSSARRVDRLRVPCPQVRWDGWDITAWDRGDGNAMVDFERVVSPDYLHDGIEARTPTSDAQAEAYRIVERRLRCRIPNAARMTPHEFSREAYGGWSLLVTHRNADNGERLVRYQLVERI